MHRAQGNTDDERMKALAVASAAMAVGNAIQSASPIKVNVGFGSSKSESRSTQAASLAAGSTVAAGGDVRIEARRKGSGDGSGDDSENGGRVGASSTNPAADGNLTLRGSRITAGGDADRPAGGNVTLAADGDLRLLAAKNTSEQHSSDRSSSAFVGISVGDPKSMGVTASGSRARGNADGQDVFWTNTQVEAGNRLTIESGGDTTVQGAVAKSKDVVAHVGGNLLVESLQVTSDYRSRQQSIGGSVTVGPAPGGSVSVGRSKIDSTYASVAEQSGIKAGDGGFDISVRGDTELKGGMIASTQAAVDADRNRFATGGTLSLADIENRASYEAKAFAVSAGVGGSLGASAGLGHDDGQAASTTRAGIGGIAGHKDVRTGDAETGIAKIFDANKVQKDIDAQVQITQTFTREAPKAVATFAQTKTKPIDDAEKYRDLATLRARGELNADQAEALAKLEHDGLTPEKAQATLNDPQAKQDYENWKEGGAYRVALHTLSGALVGGVQGAIGAGGVATGAQQLNDWQDGVEKQLATLGLPAGAAKMAAQGIGQLTALAIGSVAGPQGAATALGVDANNRQLHPSEARLIKDNARRYADKRGIGLDQAEAELTQQALRNVDSAHATRLGLNDPLAQDFLVEIAASQALADPMTGQSYRLFVADQATRDNHAMFGQYAKVDTVTETALDRAYLPKYRPARGQTIEGVSGSNAGALTGSDLALMDAATDRKHMIQQPPAVQWAVLGQLRHERQENLKAQAALVDERRALYERGDNSRTAALRRTEINDTLDRLAAENLNLLQASRQQILTMHEAGMLQSGEQRETWEEYGASRSMAGLNLRGVSSASIVARYNMLKASIQEARAIADAEKASQRGVENARVDGNLRRDDTLQYGSGTAPINVPEKVTRRDNDFSATENYKGNSKAHTDFEGNLIAANPEGTGSIQSHVRGSNPDNTPWISTTDPRLADTPKYYGSTQIVINARDLQRDINAGRVIQNVEIVPPQSVQAELQTKIDAAQARYDRVPSPENEKRLITAQTDLANAIRDGECLIRPCVPAPYIIWPNGVPQLPKR
jgi:hypothetical protein